MGHPLLRAVKGYKTKTGMWRTACSVLRGAAFSRRRFLFPQIGESRAAHKSGSSSIKISIGPRSNHSLALSLSHSFGVRREVKTLVLSKREGGCRTRPRYLYIWQCLQASLWRTFIDFRIYALLSSKPKWSNIVTLFGDYSGPPMPPPLSSCLIPTPHAC